MKTPNISTFLACVFVLLFSISWRSSSQTNEDFVQCLLHNSTSLSQIVYTPNNSSFLPILLLYIQNQRFIYPNLPKPQVIVTPVNESQIPPVMYCSKKYEIQIRIRSGGHDFEGLSYRSEVPYVILDLFNLRSIAVDVENSTAWVQAGADLGELIYYIAQSSRTLAFPSGYAPTVGVGGQLSGGGYGSLLRKYGLASDNILDARFIDVNGRILTKDTMGEDLFWAIRGGGGGNFGVVVAWKINLVSVPANVTIFTVNRTLEQNATKLVHQWQYVAPELDRNLFLRINIRSVNTTQYGNRTILASFQALFLGGTDALVSLMQQKFPELGLRKQDCNETSYVRSVLDSNGFIGAPPEVLLNRTYPPRQYLKGKADYVTDPIPEEGLEGIWQRYFQIPAGVAEMDWSPFGGRMSEISASEYPFPYRAGYLFIIYNAVYWDNATRSEAPSRINWIRSLYSYLTPYVSMNPRGAYANYRDLDLGENNITGNTSYEQASMWGIKYFNGNFHRLVRVKTMVDPSNFFRNEQSIPINVSAVPGMQGY